MCLAYLDTCIVIYLIGGRGVVQRADPPVSGPKGQHATVRVALGASGSNRQTAPRFGCQAGCGLEDFLSAQHWLASDDRIFARACRLRADHGLKTPDALHLATALQYACDQFWTNDDRLSRAAGGMAIGVLTTCE